MFAPRAHRRTPLALGIACFAITPIFVAKEAEALLAAMLTRPGPLLAQAACAMFELG